MPEVGGLDVVRQVSRAALPLVAFVTAFDDHAIEAFELNAIDYLLKPVEQARLAATITRARERLERHEPAEERAASAGCRRRGLRTAATAPWLERIPVRRSRRCDRHRPGAADRLDRRRARAAAPDDRLAASATRSRIDCTRLEARLDPRRFVRLGRSALANIDTIVQSHLDARRRVEATLTNGQELPVSRIQSRVVRERLLKL